MAPRTTFGQRGGAAPPARAAAPSVTTAPPVTQQAESKTSAPIGGADAAIPMVTMGLVAILTAIFWMETSLATDFTAPLSPSRQALTDLGGIEPQLVFGAGEWWRLFTAPLLHANLSHLIGNCVVLGLIGYYLEPLVGSAWFAAIFAVAALGGDIGSMGQDQPTLLSVGASGAITGLLAAALVCASRMRDDRRRARMQRWAGRVLIYATLPAYLSASAVSGHTDYGAHVGGALFGGVAGFLVTFTWDWKTGRPSLERFAMGIGGAFSVLAALSFLLAYRDTGAHTADAPDLISYKEMPKTNKDAMARSYDLVARYPADPRAHYFRGLFFADRNDLPSAAEELRKALSAEQAHPEIFSAPFDQSVHMTLALVINAEGDKDAARAMAKDACAATAQSSQMLAIMRRHKICD